MNLLPSEFFKDSVEVYIAQHTTASHKIYWVVLIAVSAALCSLPFVYVDVSVQDSGVVRPVAEKTEIIAGVTEFVDSIYVREGQKVKQRDTILMFRSSVPDYRIDYQRKRLIDFEEHLTDLRRLVKGETPDPFKSKMRQQEYLLFLKQKNEYQTNLLKTEKDFERNRKLYEKRVISAEEYEKYKYDYDKAGIELSTLQESQISKWQTELNTYSNSREEMKTAMEQELKNRDLYTLVSPVSGTLDQFSGIYKGSNIQAGSRIAVISPDSTVYAEIYVSPRNIGYISIGMPVNIQVSSFNYNEWGTIRGQVMEISSDFLTDSGDNSFFYKVKCSLENNFLIRKNGVKGVLKKGMPVSAHFIITKRSLFDLLYQKMDDWINPAQYNIN
ncbi:MAG: HlyD family secretion protein [Prevotellaceae bacterium]|jgi:multidrug resistance efflux pump|nr:HlyD family secretion protein [Prevotellaceae bacterium]